jgi:hypothetical protein
MTYPYLFGCGTELSKVLAKIGLDHLIMFFTHPFYYLLVLYIALVSILLITTKRIFPKIFLLYTNVVMLVLFKFFYPGFYHHFIFFFVYLIVFLWISNAEKILCKSKKVNFINVLMALMLIPPINVNLEIEPMYNVKGSYNAMKNLVKYLNSNSMFKDSIIYVDGSIYQIIPYLHNNAEIMDTCSLKPVTWDTLKYLECIPNSELKIKNVSSKRSFLLSQTKKDNVSDKIIGEVDKIYIYEYK